MTIKVAVDKLEYWFWCVSTLKLNTWKMMFGIMGGTSASYVFDNEEDATAFKIRFGL